MSVATLTKGPGDVLDYVLDYSVWLISPDVIFSSGWVAPAALTLSGEADTDDTTTVFVAGGKVGVTYKVTNTIVTTGGRTKVVTFDLKIVDS